MVKSNHIKLKKICPAHYIFFISPVQLFEIPQKKLFEKNVEKNRYSDFFQHFFQKAFFEGFQKAVRD